MRTLVSLDIETTGLDAEREAIRRAGHERCLRDHTWQRRFEAAFREMGLA